MPASSQGCLWKRSWHDAARDPRRRVQRRRLGGIPRNRSAVARRWLHPSRPVGYVEGWFVAQEYRRQGVGAKLLAAAEDWARSHGCVEMASDTWIDNDVSQRAHEALGFEVVDRFVHYRKNL